MKKTIFTSLIIMCFAAMVSAAEIEIKHLDAPKEFLQTKNEVWQKKLDMEISFNNKNCKLEFIFKPVEFVTEVKIDRTRVKPTSDRYTITSGMTFRDFLWSLCEELKLEAKWKTDGKVDEPYM
jgi:hypothetical protein